MPGYLRQSTASQSRSLGPFVDETDFKTAETALTIANTDIKLCVNGGASANKNSGGGTHRVNGHYGVTFDATDTATVGELNVSVVVSGALQVFDKFFVVEETVYDALFVASAPGYLQPTTAGRTLDVSSTGEAGVDWANVGSPTTTVGLTNTTISSAQVVASVTGAVGSVTGNVGGNVVGSVGSVTGAVGSVTGSVGSVTGNVGGNVVGSVGSVSGNVGGNVNGSVGSIATGGITSASFAADSITASAIATDAITSAELAASAANEIADALLDRTSGIETGYTPRQALRVILAAEGGKLSGAATTTIAIRDVNDAVTRISATVDADGNRSAVTLNTA
jgi:hypothetical protein